MIPHLWLWVEFIVLFVGVPLGFLFSPWRLQPIVVLWSATAYCLVTLRIAGTHVSLWNAAPFRAHWFDIFIMFFASTILFVVGVEWFAPKLLFRFPRRETKLWVIIMVMYPVLSVYPQGILYRVFLMTRYQPLFPGRWPLILASGIAFAFMHVVFRNPFAILITLLGGLIFAWRYDQTGSLAVTAFEHALYGCFLFTVGLGDNLYHMRVKTKTHTDAAAPIVPLETTV